MELILTDLERANQRTLTAECMDRYHSRKHLNAPTSTHIKQTIQGFLSLAQAQQPDTQVLQPGTDQQQQTCQAGHTILHPEA